MTRRPASVAVLFARADSNYFAIPGCDVFDLARDARSFAGGLPVVAHPPCRGWGRLSKFSHATEDERLLAVFAVEQVRRFGGVLEHPACSKLFAHASLPFPGEFPDSFGGYTLSVEQFHWGHRAEKATWLYVVGCSQSSLPVIPVRPGRPTHCIRPSKSYPRLPSVTKAEREHTPVDFAVWLVDLARRCGSRELFA